MLQHSMDYNNTAPTTLNNDNKLIGASRNASDEGGEEVGAAAELTPRFVVELAVAILDEVAEGESTELAVLVPLSNVLLSVTGQLLPPEFPSAELT